MICPRCQNQLPDNSVACNRCGLMFNFQQPQQIPQQQYYNAPPQQQPMPANKKSSKKLIFTLIGIIVGAIVLAVVTGLILNNLPKTIDYGDAEAFEQALNDGVNVTNKVVRFKIREYATPVAGYNLHAGKHLNFVSFSNPGVSTGDTITVKVTRVQYLGDGIWNIWYKKVKNGKETSSTIKSD